MFYEDIFDGDDHDLFELPLTTSVVDDDPLDNAIKQGENEGQEIPSDFVFPGEDFMGFSFDNEMIIPHIPQSEVIHSPLPQAINNQDRMCQPQHVYEQRMEMDVNKRDSRSTSPTYSSTSEGSFGGQSDEEISNQIIPPPPPSSTRKTNRNRNNNIEKAGRRRKRKRHEIEEDTKRLAFLRNKKNKSEAEKAELRKLRNRDSAMRSRAKKAKEMKTKDNQISEQRLTIRSLREDVETLTTEVDSLKRENAFLKDKNRSLLERLRIQPGTLYSCAVLLVLFLIMAFMFCKSPFSLGIMDHLNEFSLVSSPDQDEFFSYRDPLGMYEWEFDGIKALPESTTKQLPPPSSSSSSSSSSSLVIRGDDEYVYVYSDQEGDDPIHDPTIQQHPHHDNMCYFGEYMNGMIPVDKKVKTTIRDPLFEGGLERLLKKRELHFEEEMYHHFVSPPQFVYVNSEDHHFTGDQQEQEQGGGSQKRRITSVPPAMTTDISGGDVDNSQCDSGLGRNVSKNSNDTIFIDDEDEDWFFSHQQEQEQKEHVVEQEEEEEDDEMMYRYLRKNESGEIVGYYYSTEDWENKEVFMTPHIFHLNGNQEFQNTAQDGGVYSENVYDSGEHDDDRELILVFPVEQLRGENGEGVGVFKLAEIHIPSRAVHFGESFWSFKPLKGQFDASESES